MRSPRRIGIGLATCVALAAFACTAFAATRLTIPAATKRATAFAARTCANDHRCIDSGVTNCRRQSPHIVFCRTYLRRNTRVQGGYRCTRLIRLAIDPKTHRVPVTGVGRWTC